MGLKPNQKMLSATINQDLYEKMEAIAKKEFGSINKFCNRVIEYIVNHPEVIAEVRFKSAQQNLSDEFSKYIKFHPHGDEDVDRILKQLSKDFTAINNEENSKMNSD